MRQTPRKLLREVLAETNDSLEAMRAVRKRFGLSIEEVKDLWVKVTEKAVSLTEQEEILINAPLRIVCPSCRLPESIERKVHLLPLGLMNDSSKLVNPHGPDFVNGFWCKACGVGFVPDHLLEELGLVTIRPI